ncbi:MAG TPA: hypothetical protein VD966_03965, partial [Pyrinomonadaceae bacterium]|nr:hypothetical protein [Pyrinomonadaceae bacterium]
YAVSPTQINFYVPAGLQSGPAEVIVTSLDGRVARGTATMAPLVPAMFTLDGKGTGAGAVLNAATYRPGPFDVTTQENLSTDKRTRLLIFATGISSGAANTNLSNDLSTRSGVIANLAESVVVKARTSGGVTHQLAVEFAGAQSNLAGLDQISVVLPSSLRGAGNLTLSLTIGGQSSNEVTVSIR